MKYLIDKAYKVVKENGWYHEETVLVIIDHRLRRKFEVNYHDDERESNEYGKSLIKFYSDGNQTCYQYEFLVEVHCDETGKISHYTTYNDEVFLEYLAKYCEEQRKK